MLSVREADEVRYDFSGMDGLTILDDFKPDHKPVVVATLQKDMLCIYTGSQDHRWGPLRSLSMAALPPLST